MESNNSSKKKSSLSDCKPCSKKQIKEPIEEIIASEMKKQSETEGCQEVERTQEVKLSSKKKESILQEDCNIVEEIKQNST